MEHRSKYHNTISGAASQAERPARERLAEEAARELAAAVYVCPFKAPNNHELVFSYPAPGVNVYRNLDTNELVVLRRRSADKFDKLGENGWEDWSS